MFDHDEESLAGGYWPSVTDLFITLFIITIVILAVVFFLSANRGLGPLFGEIRKPTNELREVLGLSRIRETQSPYQVVVAVRETSESAIAKIAELQGTINQKEDEIARLKNAITDPDRIAKLEAEIASLKKEKDSLSKRIAEFEKRIDNLGGSEVNRSELERLRKENAELKETSPTHVIDEKRKEFSFDSGSPVIKRDFSVALRKDSEKNKAPFPDFATKIIARPDRFDTLEIIGHTDGVPLSTIGNLDQRLPDLLANELAGSLALIAGSNNDLGLLRALALKQQWSDYVESYKPVENREILRSIQIRCYSAGQTILPVQIDDPKPVDFRKNDPRARRIEMRLTRLGKVGSNGEVDTSANER